jgi:hypothetical protein
MTRLLLSVSHYVVQVGGAFVLMALALPAGTLPALLACAAGWVTGSFAEYALHRHFLHGAPRFARVHARHHDRPAEHQLDPVSYLAPFGFHIAAWIAAYLLTGRAEVAHAVVAGGFLQYAYFRAVHRWLHRAGGSPILRDLARFHHAHHHDPRGNFGVSTRFWDRLFGTGTVPGVERRAAPGNPAGTVAPTAPQSVAPLSGYAGADRPPLTLHDPAPVGDTPRNRLERACLDWLKDPRDLVFVRLACSASAALLPAACLVYAVPAWCAWLLAPPYLWLLYAKLGGPVMLMVHALSHRASFAAGGRWLDRYIRHGMPLLYGLQPFAYFPQHVLMHHAENNRACDLSSTLGYRRDSATDFLRYWLRFMTLDNFGLAAYLWRAGRRAALARYAAGSLAFFTLVALLYWRSPAATCVVFVLPYVLTRFFLMAGNWAQHAFIHPAPRDPRLQQATLLVNASHNRRCFNDGYHALHHRWPGLHWADMPARFRADWRHFAEHEVLVFSGVPNNQVIWWRLMTKDYDYLARHLVHFDWLPDGHAARVALLKDRVRGRHDTGA